MKINEVIRKCRKEQNLTQEQVANYLGVTAPAVNKWENGVSYPDITMLAPLARVLKTNVDTLLSFKEEITDKEINDFIREISKDVSVEGYVNTFEKASKKIKEYPTCDKLILNLAQVLNGYLLMGTEEVNDREKYQRQIVAWFESVAFSNDTEVSKMAIMSLSQNYITQGEYEEAQKLLDQIPEVGYDKRMTQVSLYRKQGNYEKAFEVQETMLYQSVNSVTSSLLQLSTLLCEQNEYDVALEYADLVDSVARQFDLGSFVGASAKLAIYVKLQDVTNSLHTLEDALNGLDSLRDMRSSKLYCHMKFNEEDGIDQMKVMMKKSLLTDPELEFLRDTPQFKVLLANLKS